MDRTAVAVDLTAAVAVDLTAAVVGSTGAAEEDFTADHLEEAGLRLRIGAGHSADAPAVRSGDAPAVRSGGAPAVRSAGGPAVRSAGDSAPVQQAADSAAAAADRWDRAVRLPTDSGIHSVAPDPGQGRQRVEDLQIPHMPTAHGIRLEAAAVARREEHPARRGHSGDRAPVPR